MLDQLRNQIREFIAAGQLMAAFERLRICLAEHSEYSKLILTRLCSYQSAKKQFIGGMLSHKEFQVLQTQVAAALLTLVDEISEADFGEYTRGTWEETLQEIALGQMGKLQLVNCDRKEPFGSFASFFKQHGTLTYQFYFIAGSPNQKPSSFAERIIYEIIEDKQIQEDNSVVEYEHDEVCLGDTKIERLKFHTLPLGLNAE